MDYTKKNAHFFELCAKKNNNGSFKKSFSLYDFSITFRIATMGFFYRNHIQYYRRQYKNSLCL